MTLYAQIAQNIIQRQEAIIGPVAVEQAKRVHGLKLDWDNKDVAIDGDEVLVISELVEAYKELFGQMSVEVCREAAAPLLSQLPTGKELPEALR
jgi:hypothetical protein